MEEEKPPIRIFIAAALIPEAEAFLVHHQCTVECHLENDGFRTTVTLPHGSVRKRCGMVVASERYSVDLPDGTQLREVYDPGKGTSALFIPAQAFKGGNDGAERQ
jgi:hypothetical protein